MNEGLLTVQVVGLKNSGKTTLICDLIETATNGGYKVASIKHHGHGGPPQTVGHTDSERHKQAGALMAGVEGDGVLQLSISNKEWTIDQILAFYKLIEINLLIIEGYKKVNYPKIILIKKEEDLYLLNELTNIVAAIAPFELTTNYLFPVFLQHDLSSFKKWFRLFIEEKLQKK